MFDRLKVAGRQIDGLLRLSIPGASLKLNASSRFRDSPIIDQEGDASINSAPGQGGR
jgi:hypothetical protein